VSSSLGNHITATMSRGARLFLRTNAFCLLLPKTSANARYKNVSRVGVPEDSLLGILIWKSSAFPSGQVPGRERTDSHKKGKTKEKKRNIPPPSLSPPHTGTNKHEQEKEKYRWRKQQEKRKYKTAVTKGNPTRQKLRADEKNHKGKKLDMKTNQDK